MSQLTDDTTELEIKADEQKILTPWSLVDSCFWAVIVASGCITLMFGAVWLGKVLARFITG